MVTLDMRARNASTARSVAAAAAVKQLRRKKIRLHVSKVLEISERKRTGTTDRGGIAKATVVIAVLLGIQTLLQQILERGATRQQIRQMSESTEIRATETHHKQTNRHVKAQSNCSKSKVNAAMGTSSLISTACMVVKACVVVRCERVQRWYKPVHECDSDGQ
jgi:hypothetical protein